LKSFPVLSGNGIDVPSTQTALWLWLRGHDRGELVHRSRSWIDLLAEAFEPVQILDAFMYGSGRDLTGYEDGTENPVGDEAIEAALVLEGPDGLRGSSFVAVQTWEHDLDAFFAHSQGEQDHIIGRRLSDNEELEDAPESAHVKRTAQEDFDPPAFMVRRSMPWTDGDQNGLVFVAFGSSLSPFERQLRKMVGLDDGISDALFRFSRPVTGSSYWCPPVEDGRLNLGLILQ